jgi:hypothetical protein
MADNSRRAGLLTYEMAIYWNNGILSSPAPPPIIRHVGLVMLSHGFYPGTSRKWEYGREASRSVDITAVCFATNFVILAICQDGKILSCFRNSLGPQATT